MAQTMNNTYFQNEKKKLIYFKSTTILTFCRNYFFISQY